MLYDIIIWTVLFLWNITDLGPGLTIEDQQGMTNEGIALPADGI
jgi:hypothetical protein